MLVSRIAPYSTYSQYSSCPSHTKNNTMPAIRANQADSVSFKGNVSKTLHPAVINVINEVLGKMHGGELQTKVALAGKTCACDARLSDLNRMWHLLLDVDGKQRYAIELTDEYSASPFGKISLQNLETSKFGGTEIPLEDQPTYDAAVETVQTLLKALNENGQTQTWQYQRAAG